MAEDYSEFRSYRSEGGEAPNPNYKEIDEQRKFWAKAPTCGFLKNPEYADLSGTELRVLLFLLNRAGGGTRFGWNEKTAISLTSLQIAYGVGTTRKKTIDEALKKLKEKGLIDWAQTKDRGYRGPRKIFLHIEKIYFSTVEDNSGRFPPNEWVKKYFDEPTNPRPPLTPKNELYRPDSSVYSEDIFGSEKEKTKQKQTLPQPPASQPSSPDNASSKLKAQGVEF